MREGYLEATFRHGRPVAAYFYLPQRGDEKSARTSIKERGMVVDFDESGKAIGIEITAPSKTSAADLNRVLYELGLPPVTGDDMAPLWAA